MYMEPEEQEKVFKEAWRVLKHGGEFWVWDITIPERAAREEDVFAVLLDVRMHGTSVRAGYGAPWASRRQDITSFRKAAAAAGFECTGTRLDDQVIFLRLRKPSRGEPPPA